MKHIVVCLIVLAGLLASWVMSSSAQWYPQNSGTTKNLNAVHFLDANKGFAVGDSGIVLQTSDDGTTWSKQEDFTGHTLRDIFLVNANIGWAVGGDGSNYSTEGVILHTTNGGAIWTSQAYQGTLNACWFADSARGWLVGNIVDDSLIQRGHILSTTDGGTNWDTTEVGDGLNDVCFANSKVGWVVQPRVYTVESFLFSTLDGGLTWDGDAITDGWLYRMAFADTSLGVGVGYIGEGRSEGLVLVTADGGKSWTGRWFGPPATVLMDVSIMSPNVYVLVGSNGSVLRSKDAGMTWDLQTTGRSEALVGVHFIDDLTGWVVGQKGVVLHTTNGGVTFVERDEISEVPTDFSLSQNYPNPFNPSTTISFTIPYSSFVTLKVFDVLGMGVATLVNEEMKAGRYERPLDASEFASGVYFYRLMTRDFVHTKEMIILR